MLAAALSVRSLLAAIFMMMAGGGFLQTLLSVRLEKAGYGALSIGAVATAYFAGLTVGALRAGPIVQRVGHIRAFAAFVALYSATALIYALYRDPFVWGALRFTDGLCVAGVFICLESWLNERAEPQSRSSILAAYMIFLYLGQAAGQFLLNVSDTKPSLPFVAASILISLSAIPVLLTRIAAPLIEANSPMPLRRLYVISPLGAVGAVVTGLMLGAFYGLAAVHIARLGLNLAETARFMSVVIIGGVALQWPLGRLSDRFDRRRVIVITFAATALSCIAIAMVRQGGAPLLLLGALFGGFSFALYPLCVAHTNDHLDPRQRVGATGGLVLLYSIGAALGPVAGAASMTVAGSGGLFWFIALCAAATLGFGLWRQATTSSVPADEQLDYQILPRTTPAAAMLDPHVPEQSEALSQEWPIGKNG